MPPIHDHEAGRGKPAHVRISLVRSLVAHAFSSPVARKHPLIGLKAGVEDAAKQVLNRLYPKFNDGDSAKWPQVLKKAKRGSANALEQVGFTGDPQTHPVAAAILSFIGAGKTGLEVRKKFNGGPYGWPQDAIDAVLTTLLASNHLSAKINGNPLPLGEVDQKKLGQAAFRIESPVLTAPQKLVFESSSKRPAFRRQLQGTNLQTQSGLSIMRKRLRRRRAETLLLRILPPHRRLPRSNR